MEEKVGKARDFNGKVQKILLGFFILMLMGISFLAGNSPEGEFMATEFSPPGADSISSQT